jgi:Holliday junction resolvase RusA-like endonuclease
MSRDVLFVVRGKPVPQGSLRALPGKGRAVGRIVMPQSPELIAWRSIVAFSARRAWRRPPVRDEPVAIALDFYLHRPASTKRAYPHAKPDADKLARGVLDALSAVIYHDDAQVVDLLVRKRYGEPGVTVGVTWLATREGA